MAQVSYGTITITDTTDIERIYPVYCRGGETTAPALQPLTNWSESVSQAGGSGEYIWQRIVTKKQNVAVVAVDYSDAVRLTGDDGAALTILSTQYAQTQNETDTPSYGNSMPNPIKEGWWLWVKVNYSDGNATVTKIKQGQTGEQGYSVVSTRELYYLKTNASDVAQITSSSQITNTNRQNGWTSIVPDYVENGTYYTCIETTLDSPTNNLKWSAPVENQGLTDANQKALDAYNTSIARDTEVNALKAQAKHYWWDSQGAHVAAGENTTSVDNITQGTPSTYGFNSLMAPGYLALKYKDINFAQLATNSLTFYRPAVNGSTYVQGKKGMDLTADALTFYKPLAYNSSNEPTAAATLNTNGLILSEGGVQAGTAGQSGFIYLSTKNYGSNLTINSHQASNWREIIGTKFGVDADGNLYANNAEISGKITATSLTIGSGATVSGLSTSNISGMSNYALQSSLDTEVAQRKAVYAVSTTGATTTAKATESRTPSGFILYNGATVTVKFNSANSTTTPTLNVNGTGAKTIKSYTGAALTAAEYTWPAGAAITFTYDGSYWRMQDGGALQAKADAAASASSASSSASAASSSASSASTSASNASSSATSASNSASTASTKATEASNSASTASTKASAASTSATNAANSASAASTSATNASNSASAAADSASDASDSADAAAGSASTASSKATAAANSATSASNSATSASSSATSASNSASSASNSATTATNKANAASESATNAANSATAASGSATSAANSATAASNSATSASNSATAASNSATAAAEVMGGFTILWNYSAFGTSTAGDAFICGFDPATGTKSDANGWIKWNSTKRTITKQQVNPGTIVPYNIPIYIVCRLSSATGTTGTNYMVWYNAGWKYAACPSPTAVGGSWTWTDNRDIILGSFVETGANEVLTECELFNPPWTSKQITTNTTTPTSYIMDVDSNKGITVKPKDSSGNDFLQMNSTAIEFFRNSTTASVMRLTDNSFRLGLEASNHTTIDTNGLHIWAGTESTATNELALFSSTARIGKTNNSRFLMNASSLQAYNSSNKLYFEVSSSGIKYGTDLSSTSTTVTVASTSYADNKAGAAQTAATNAAATDATNKANEAAKTATNYITNIDANGIWVTPSGKKPTNTSTGAGATGTKIDGTGVGIYVDGIKLAQYGTTTYFYEPDGTTAATLDGTGLNIKTGTITLGSNFSVTSAGALTAKSGTIAGWSFNTTSLYKNNATPGAASNAMVISTGTSSSTSIGGSSGTQSWMLSAGTGFGVTTGGILYASGAHIAGTIMVGEGSNVYTTDEINDNVEQLREDIYGTVTFEYASGDTIYTVYSDLQSSDNTTVYYYYGGDGSEIEANRVYVNESDLVKNTDGSLKENTKGLVAEQVSKLSATTEDLNTKYDELSNKEDLSLIAQGYATINDDILTLFKQNSNGEVESALELTSTGIDLKAEGITVATMRNDNGIGIMQATNMEQTFVKMIQSDGTELFQWIAQSNGHLSLKKL